MGERYLGSKSHALRMMDALLEVSILRKRKCASYKIGLDWPQNVPSKLVPALTLSAAQSISMTGDEEIHNLTKK